MELRHIRVFLALSEEKHFGRAARRLHVVQSAVSQTLKLLEEDLGVCLFERGRGGVHITEAGVAFERAARRALAVIEAGTYEARAVDRGDRGHLRVHLGPLGGLTAVPKLAARFKREHPGVDVRVGPAAADAPLDALRDGEADLVFVTAAKHALDGLVARPVVRAPVVAVLPRRHPLARRSTLALRALSGETLMLLERFTRQQSPETLEKLRTAVGFDPAEIVNAGSLDAALGLVGAGFGVALLPAFAVHRKPPGVAVVLVRPKLMAGIDAVFDPARLSATARRFLALLASADEDRTPS